MIKKMNQEEIKFHLSYLISQRDYLISYKQGQHNSKLNTFSCFFAAYAISISMVTAFAKSYIFHVTIFYFVIFISFLISNYLFKKVNHIDEKINYFQSEIEKAHYNYFKTKEE
jgi:hypothetical protein